MKKYFILTFFLGIFLIAGNATATYINPVGGGDGDESSLQGVLNSFTQGGNSSVDAEGSDNDAISDSIDSIWQITGTGLSAGVLIVEIAGNASGNTFGIYDPYDLTKTVTLFAGADEAGDKFTITRDTADQSWIYSHPSDPLSIVDTNIIFATSYFGYYLSGPGGTFYSDTSLNTDGFDHMVAFQGTGDPIKLPWETAFTTWTPSEYVLGWEDVIGRSSDQDYQDLVVMVESVQPIPEPATMLLLGTGLMGLAVIGRRKFKK